MPRFLALISVCLAGCGAGGAGSEGNGVGDLAQFDSRYDTVTAGDVTPIAQLPASGTLRYSGDVALSLPLGGVPVRYLGDFDIHISFDAGDDPVTGSASGFVSADSGRLSGQLTIRNGAMNPDADPATEYLFAADMSGSLVQGSDSFVLIGELAGDPYGRNADAVAGVVFGDIRGPGGTDLFDGRFVGSRY